MNKMLLTLAVAVAAVGCSNQPATATAAPSVADAAPPPPPPPGNKSGDRLKIRTQRGDDGSLRLLEARYDAKYKERCDSSCGSDGKQHCLPDGAMVLDSYYADKDCTQRIAMVVKGRPAPVHAALASKDKLTGNAWWCEYEHQNRIFKIEGEYRESYLYLKDEKSGGCSKITEKEDSSLSDFLKHSQVFSVSSEVSPSEFVMLTANVEGNAGETIAAPETTAAPENKAAVPAVK